MANTKTDTKTEEMAGERLPPPDSQFDVEVSLSHVFRAEEDVEDGENLGQRIWQKARSLAGISTNSATGPCGWWREISVAHWLVSAALAAQDNGRTRALIRSAVQLDGTGSLRGADLSGTNWRGAEFPWTRDFAGAVMRNCDFSAADLREADFRGADLRGSLLVAADLSYADFRGADLRDVNFSGSTLDYADLNNTDLRGAYFGRVSNKETRLQRARLT